ncbi:ABC transporter permease [Pseudomonas gingeri NCPPB 3146 = LMG 5327]|uniref:ABC transporter permease n=3 Tax=Pseudomonas gingeri TaxID=117681 RepID=A0A7Y7XWN1_9PSED|nr:MULTISPECIES: ABC transporter permease [Pseudomonas]NVZ24534.1 ABC transporter permease [Pseudomonas gingeri]NVZ60606.1 ABC transporter permease [Pseudomonas gingeri]NVZ77185.1 ABC transporter permease [Pseudomonas gingeri]NWC13401.1 ABC transporter permease [Pseudomonas gingeri]PNQ94445.1 ABC transporter permease [Pseudomonas gingeri NCPPB 3146 = LMG 5327]
MNNQLLAKTRLGGVLPKWIGVDSSVAGPLLGLLLLCVVLTVFTDNFLSVSNLLNVLDQVTVLGIMALGMTLVILIGGIDLSVGAVLAVAIMVMSWLGQALGVPMWLAMLAALVVGAACGATTALLVVRAGLPSFIATLAMMSVARGLAYMVTDGAQVSGFPEWFSNLSVIRYGGVLSLTVLCFLLLALLFWFVLRFTVAGRSLYAIGGSAKVARLAGIRVKGYTSAVYILSGICAALGGIIMTSRLDTAGAGAGVGYELDVIAAVVIGGGSLKGGAGSVVGTLVGVLIIGVLRNGLNLAGISPFVQQVVIGAVIAFAVMLDLLKRKGD